MAEEFLKEKERWRMLWARVTLIKAKYNNYFRNKNDVIEAALDALEEQLQNNPEKLKGRFKK